MKTNVRNFLKSALIIAVVGGCLSSCDDFPITNQKDLERGYFEGQKDALNGDIRIKLNKDSVYVWKKSPWNNGTEPIYNPTYLDSQNNR